MVFATTTTTAATITTAINHSLQETRIIPAETTTYTHDSVLQQYSLSIAPQQVMKVPFISGVGQMWNS